MKRISGVWERIVDMETLKEAAKRSCRARKDKAEVAEFLADAGRKLEDLRRALVDGSYHTSEYRFFTIRENGKTRVIADLPLYPDRIVHWAVALAVEGPMNRKLIDQTYGARPGGGHHKAVRQLERYIRGDARVRFALSMDVKQFFPSIDKGALKSMLRSVLKDRRALDLLCRIVDEYPRDGIPLGNRTSPMLANLYLSGVDHALKQGSRCHYYLRYMDDMVVLGYSKPWLHRIRRMVAGMLGEVGLELKGSWQVYPIERRGVLYLGYRVFRTHTLLRKRTKVRMRRALGRIRDAEGLTAHDLGVIRSYEGLLSWCDGVHLAESVIAPALRAHGLEWAARRKAQRHEIRDRNRMGAGRLPRRDHPEAPRPRGAGPDPRGPRGRAADRARDQRGPDTPRDVRDRVRRLRGHGLQLRGRGRGRDRDIQSRGVYGEAESLPQAYRKELIETITQGGRATDALAVISMAEGMSGPPQTISKALLARFSARTEAERRSALTDYVMALVASGAQVEYWDAVSHLYTESEMEEIKSRKAEAEERKRQMDAVKDMLDMSRARFGPTEGS